MFVPFSELDVDLCVSSGQVFRFHKTGEGWIGIDGSDVVTARRVQGGWEVSESGRELFQLQISLCDIERRILERSGELAKRLGRFRGLRVLKQKYAHETLFSFLCTPNNNLNRIVPMVRHLGSYGNEICDGLYEFPSIERIAEIPQSWVRLSCKNDSQCSAPSPCEAGAMASIVANHAVQGSAFVPLRN